MVLNQTPEWLLLVVQALMAAMRVSARAAFNFDRLAVNCDNAGGAALARYAAPRGGRLGSEPAVDGAGGAGGPLRRQAVRP